MLTNATFWLQVTLKSLEILTNLKLKAVKKKKQQLHQLALRFLLSIITSLCKKASQKLHALARITHYMDFEKRRSLMKAFVIFQFNYCPLIWMFQNRALNDRINKIHERALWLVYQNKNLSLSELVELDNVVTTHQRNLQVLLVCRNFKSKK